MRNKISIYITIILFVFIPLFLVLIGCTRTLYVPVEKVTTITQTVRDTVVNVKIERETTTKQTKDTTVTAETSYSVAEASWRGSTECLELTLFNKDMAIPVEVRYIETTRIDSIPSPYPVEVIKEVQYVAWYDKAARYVALALVIVILFTLARKKLWT